MTDKKEKVSKLKLKLGTLQWESMNLATTFQRTQERLKAITQEMVAIGKDITKLEGTNG